MPEHAKSGCGLSSADLAALERTLDLAALGRAVVAPNPMVGAVVMTGEVTLGEGFHRGAGGPHGEIEALNDADLRGNRESLAGATLYVNLEPCCHHGRTGPCTEAVLRSGVSRVVCCHRDPNPEARGGAELLREAGLEIAFLSPAVPVEQDLLERATVLNASFLVPVVRGRPLVTLKWAMSLDGKIATRSGESQWISSPAARDWAVSQRDSHDAILVGSGTAIADDPRLNRRSGANEGSIARVVLDRRLRVSPVAAMLQVEGPVVIMTSNGAASAEGGPTKVAQLEAAGATVVSLEELTPATAVAALGERGIQSILVEGGSEILGAFLDEGLCDRVGVCCAGLLIGGASAPGAFAGRGVESLSNGLRLARSSASMVGADCVIEGIEETCLQDLLSSVAES